MIMHRMIFSLVAACLLLGPATVGRTAPPFEVDRSVSFQVELTAASRTDEASIREHAITWHPAKKKYYLVADVVPLDSPHHPNTYDTSDVPKTEPHAERDRPALAGLLHELWRTRLAVNSPTNVIVGRLDDRAYLCVQGSDATQGRGGTVEARSAEGRPLWRSSAGAGRGIGAYLQWIDLGGDAEPLVAFSFVPSEAKEPGGARFIRARDGILVKEIQNVFGMQGKLKSKIELGFTGIAIGDMDGDGHLDGVGLTNTRDGGHNGHREARCIDLATGRVKWTTPVERAYLDANSPIMADLNGDGNLEAVVGTGNPAGYARLPDSPPWGDLYVLDGRGQILQHIELPGWPVNLATCDVNDDGWNELLALIDGLPGTLALFQTKAPATRNDWVTPFGSPQRDGTMGRATHGRTK